MRTPLMMILLLLAATEARGEIIFHQDFEDGLVPTSPSEGFHSNSVNHCCSYSIQNVPHSGVDPYPLFDGVAHDGTHALYTTCTEDDSPVQGHSHRANLTTSPGGSIGGVPILPYDQDRWFGFSVYVSRESADAVTTGGVFNTHLQNWGDAECQIRETSSPVGLRFVGHSYRWSGPGTERPLPYFWGIMTHPVLEHGADRSGYLLMLDASEDVGAWTDFVLQIRLSYDEGRGLLRVWRNGELVYENETFDMTNNPIPQSCGRAYPKIGAGTAVIEADPGGDGLPFAILYDSIRWGDENSSYEEVDPAQDVAGGDGDIDGDADVDGDIDGDVDSDGDIDGDVDGDIDGDVDGGDDHAGCSDSPCNSACVVAGYPSGACSEGACECIDPPDVGCGCSAAGPPSSDSVFQMLLRLMTPFSS